MTRKEKDKFDQVLSHQPEVVLRETTKLINASKDFEVVRQGATEIINRLHEEQNQGDIKVSVSGK
jgi:hypothetical protein